MKSAKFLLVFLLLVPFFGFSQTLTGLWVGSLTNDSSTLRRDQSFEMALTEYKGKNYGYSHTTFMVHDTLFYVVKRVKGSIDGNVAEVKDDELVSCNFMTKLDKGVKQVYTFRLSTEDSIWRLDGNWKTNKTKNYYSISGSVKTATEKDLTKSKLFPHLQELNLTDAVATLNPPKKEPEPVKQTEKKPDIQEQAIAKKEPAKQKEKPIAKTENVSTPPANNIAKTNKETEKQKEETKPTTTSSTPQPDIATTTPAKQPEKKPEVKEDAITKNEPANQTDITVSKPKTEVPVITKPVAAANVEKRKSETIQSLEFKSDSITLSLYDNGEIDGDTVSVLINGEVILAQQGLKATAIRKTIYITPAMQDSFTLVLYAENLGKYAPNTGLIIVRDGDDAYQVRFSADLQKNVAVVFRRKKK